MNTHPLQYAAEIEQALTRFYLRSDGDQGSSPIRFIDAAPEELARAMPFFGTAPEVVRAKFIRSFTGTDVHNVLGNADIRTDPNGETPGWFRYLILSCVIASTSDEESQHGNFRDRLHENYPSRKFVNLSGTDKLWKRLQKWLENKGKPYRKLILPGHGGMNQIGQSLRIAFPARRDRERMDRVFADDDPKSWSRPATIVRRVTEELDRNRAWSPGFRAAFDDFESRYSRGYRLLANHPFWLTMQNLKPLAKVPHTRSHSAIWLETDNEGDAFFSLTTDDRLTRAALEITPEGSAETTTEITDEQMVVLLTRVPPLASFGMLNECAREGAIPFEEANAGSWRASRSPDSAYVRLLVRKDVVRRYGPWPGIQGHWFLTDRLKSGPALSILEALRPDTTSNDEILNVTIEGGIRIGAAYLGRSRYLPQIAASTAADLQITPEPGAEGELTLGPQNGAAFELNASAPLQGRWTITATEGDEAIGDVHVRFVANAAEHDFSQLKINSARWREEREISEPGDNVDIEPNPDAIPVEDVESSAIDDLLEALYAGGEHGLDARSLFDKLAPHFETNAAIWDAMRVLCESGWLEQRSSTGWRAHRWFLKSPSLVTFPNAGLVLLDGAACHTVRDRFRHCVTRAGGHVQHRVIPGLWNIPTVIGRLRDLNGLDSDTGLPFTTPTVRLPAGAQIEPPLSAYTDRSRTRVSRWCWDRQRFIKNGKIDDPVRLERLEQNGHKSTDIFEITTEGRCSIRIDARSSAILKAHQLAGRPQFRLDPTAQRLIRLANEGSLPHPLGDYFRYKYLVGPGIAVEPTKASIIQYAATAADGRQLRAWLGAAVETPPLHDDVQEFDLLSHIVDRRRGLRRPARMKHPTARSA